MNYAATFLAGFAIKALRTLADASTYILLGFAVAAALRVAVGPARLRRWFGDESRSGPLRAWGMATLLPVCALGVLPILRELKRAGVRRDALLTFALAAPMFNPLTLLYGFSYLGPGLLLQLLAGTAVVSILAGLVAGRVAVEPAVEEGTPVGASRLTAIGTTLFREASGGVWIDLAVGIVGAGLVAAAVQPAWLAEGTFAGDPWAAPLVAVVAPASYLTPEKGMTMLPDMLKFRQSAGAMFCLVALGIGMTAGHLSWAARSYGIGVAARWGAAVVGLSLAGAGVFEATHAPVGVINPDNDHYEALANPIHPGDVQHVALAFRTAWDATSSTHLATIGVLAATAVAGLILRRRPAAVQAEPGTSSSTAPAGVLNRPVSPRLAWAVVAAGVVAAGFQGAYAYYPSPEEVFRDMSVIKADFYGEIGSPSPDSRIHHLDLWSRQVARLPVGAALRLRFPTVEARDLVARLGDHIERLREAAASLPPDDARALFIAAQADYNRCKRAFGVD